MEHAADPWSIADACQGQRTIPFKFVSTNLDIGCRNAIDHGAKNGDQVDEVANGQVIRTCYSGDLGIESYAGAVRKVAVVHATDIDRSR